MRRTALPTSAVFAVLLATLTVEAAYAVGFVTWTTSPGSSGIHSVDRSQDGCTARGTGNSVADYASTYWTDSIPNSGYDCAAVAARAYIYAGANSYWTGWAIDQVNAYKSAPGMITGQHQLLTE